MIFKEGNPVPKRPGQGNDAVAMGDRLMDSDVGVCQIHYFNNCFFKKYRGSNTFLFCSSYVGFRESCASIGGVILSNTRSSFTFQLRIN